MQLQHWNLIGGGDFGLPYLSSVARFCEFNQRAGVAPQWYIGCRLMFVAGQLIEAVETDVQVRALRGASAGRADRKAAMVKAIARANMLDTEHVMAFCFGANRQLGDGVNEIGAASSQLLSSVKQSADYCRHAGGDRRISQRDRRRRRFLRIRTRF